MANEENFQWFVVERWQAFRGEARANLLRLIFISVFYVIELINFYGLNLRFLQMPQVVDRDFHILVTEIAVTWCLVGAGIHVCLQRKVFPSALKYISAGCDLFFLTLVLLVADGVTSPLVVTYFLVLGLSALRFSVRLVQFSTVGAVLGYACLIGFAKIKGFERPPHYHMVVFATSLALSGVVIGQVIRRVQVLALEFALRAKVVAEVTP